MILSNKGVWITLDVRKGYDIMAYMSQKIPREESERNKKIREMHSKGLTYSSLGFMFSISKQRAYQIVRGSNERWKILRESVFFRDKNKCQWGEKCGDRKDKLVVHHIDMNPSNNLLGNLITLCENCHWSFHLLDNEQKQFGIKQKEKGTSCG